MRSERRFHGLEGFADTGSDDLLLLEDGLELVIFLSFGFMVGVVFGGHDKADQHRYSLG